MYMYVPYVELAFLNNNVSMRGGCWGGWLVAYSIGYSPVDVADETDALLFITVKPTDGGFVSFWNELEIFRRAFRYRTTNCDSYVEGHRCDYAGNRNLCILFEIL